MRLRLHVLIGMLSAGCGHRGTAVQTPGADELLARVAARSPSPTALRFRQVVSSEVFGTATEKTGIVYIDAETIRWDYIENTALTRSFQYTATEHLVADHRTRLIQTRRQRPPVIHQILRGRASSVPTERFPELRRDRFAVHVVTARGRDRPDETVVVVDRRDLELRRVSMKTGGERNHVVFRRIAGATKMPSPLRDLLDEGYRLAVEGALEE